MRPLEVSQKGFLALPQAPCVILSKLFFLPYLKPLSSCKMHCKSLLEKQKDSTQVRLTNYTNSQQRAMSQGQTCYENKRPSFSLQVLEVVRDHQLMNQPRNLKNTNTSLGCRLQQNMQACRSPSSASNASAEELASHFGYILGKLRHQKDF